MSRHQSELEQIDDLSSKDGALDALRTMATIHRCRTPIALGNLILALTAYLTFLPYGSAHTQIADPLPATHPCAFIGVWAEIKNQMAYKVTFSENGGFMTEPIAPGTSGATYVGLWEVRGDKLEWKTSGSHRPEDISQVRNLTARSFTLVEVNGSLTAFDLIETTRTPNCPR
jgi:hypothetical protein